ncbi:calcium channel flower homolog [Anneissia japonica]|uniref:calcium channel flower homolog n=1 Tax=Anneissia japonica TaxID=1529436 RepID=UPI0014255754|nr:calcium channel flower homolog [Anneissia japonica]
MMKSTPEPKNFGSVGGDGQPPNTQDMQRDGQPPSQEMGFCFRMFVKGVGAFSALVLMALGLLNCITISGPCILSGVLMIFFGLLVLMLEVPICCSFLEITEPVNKWIESRPPWLKAISYFILAIIPVLFCHGVIVFLGVLPVFCTGVLYGLIFVGKKGDAVQSAHVNRKMEMSKLVANEQPMATKDIP